MRWICRFTLKRTHSCFVASSHSIGQSMLAETLSQELEILQAESFTACMPLLIAAGTFRLGEDAGILVVGVGNTVEYVECKDDHWLRLNIVQQVSQQAYKTQIPPYSLKHRRRPQFPMPSERQSLQLGNTPDASYCGRPYLCRRPRDSPWANVHQKGRGPVRIVGQHACKISPPSFFRRWEIRNRTKKNKQKHSKLNTPPYYRMVGVKNFFLHLWPWQ